MSGQGTPQENTGIARIYRQFRLDTKTLDFNVPDRDIPRGFTTAWRAPNGATLATLATVNASANGICYGLYVSNEGATSATVTIWAGTASFIKFRTNVLAGDYFGVPDNPNPQAPIFKWPGVKVLKARVTGSIGATRINVGVFFWAEEPI